MSTMSNVRLRVLDISGQTVAEVPATLERGPEGDRLQATRPIPCDVEIGDIAVLIDGEETLIYALQVPKGACIGMIDMPASNSGMNRLVFFRITVYYSVPPEEPEDEPEPPDEGSWRDRPALL